MKSVLGEVAVEAERRPDPQAIHHRKAGRVGEREILVVVLGDNLPRAAFVGLGRARSRKSGLNVSWNWMSRISAVSAIAMAPNAPLPVPIVVNSRPAAPEESVSFSVTTVAGPVIAPQV